MLSVPHLAWPIRVTGTTYASVQQDTDAEVGANVAVLVSFERGTRAEDPDFGITDPTFGQMPIDVSEIERQAAQYEPRADVDVRVSSDADGSARVTVAVAIATTEGA